MQELLWIRLHCGIEKNEISNFLAKEDEIFPMPGPETAIAVLGLLQHEADKTKMKQESNCEKAIKTSKLVHQKQYK